MRSANIKIQDGELIRPKKKDGELKIEEAKAKYLSANINIACFKFIFKDQISLMVMDHKLYITL